MGRNLQIIESKGLGSFSACNRSGGGGGGTGRKSLFQQLRTSRNCTEIEALLGQLGELKTVKESSMAISAWGRVRDWERALGLLSEMRERGLEPNVITYSAAISACEKGLQWEHALDLLSEMKQRGVEPDVVTYNACIQALVAAGNIDEAFVVLQGVPVGLAKDTEAHTMHRSILVACQFAGDTDRAKMVKARMELLGVSRGDPAIASAVIGGRLSEFSSGKGDSQSDAATLDLFTNVSSNSPYEVQFDALPIGFLDSSTKRQQIKSLRRHAEKKALAAMLVRGCESLEIVVNVHMCVDCHAFFKGASQSLGRRIEVRARSVLHRFNEGTCSCNDQWRWETRIVGSSQSQSSKRLPRLTSNERGNDDELAVPDKDRCEGS